MKRVNFRVRLPRHGLFRKKGTCPSSGSDSEQFSERADAALDVVQGAVKITSAFVDGVGVPAVKGALEIASKIIDLIKVCLS